MTVSTSSSSSASKALYSILIALFVCLVIQTQYTDSTSTTTLVTQFPHFQTFDSWTECFFIGPCFSQSCDDLAGGWSNEEFHGSETPYNVSVRHWWVKKGETTSNYYYQNNTYWPCNLVQTGPCDDHTMNNDTGGYLYAEATSCQGVFFRVLTPPIRFSASNAFVSFWYFMFGSNLNTGGSQGYLELSMSVSGAPFVILTNITGSHQTNGSSPWRQYNKTLDSYFPSNLNENNTVTAQFRFTAFGAGNTDDQWRGDIAIDDVLFSQAGASGDLVPYIDPVPSNDTTGTTGATVITGDGDGISDGQIAGIVVGVVVGLLLCCCFLITLVIVLLLIISPKKPQGPMPGAQPEEL